MFPSLHETEHHDSKEYDEHSLDEGDPEILRSAEMEDLFGDALAELRNTRVLRRVSTSSLSLPVY